MQIADVNGSPDAGDALESGRADENLAPVRQIAAIVVVDLLVIRRGDLLQAGTVNGHFHDVPDMLFRVALAKEEFAGVEIDIEVAEVFAAVDELNGFACARPKRRPNNRVRVTAHRQVGINGPILWQSPRTGGGTAHVEQLVEIRAGMPLVDVDHQRPHFPGEEIAFIGLLCGCDLHAEFRRVFHQAVGILEVVRIGFRKGMDGPDERLGMEKIESELIHRMLAALFEQLADRRQIRKILRPLDQIRGVVSQRAVDSTGIARRHLMQTLGRRIMKKLRAAQLQLDLFGGLGEIPQQKRLQRGEVAIRADFGCGHEHRLDPRGLLFVSGLDFFGARLSDFCALCRSWRECFRRLYLEKRGFRSRRRALRDGWQRCEETAESDNGRRTIWDIREEHGRSDCKRCNPLKEE